MAYNPNQTQNMHEPEIENIGNRIIDSPDVDWDHDWKHNPEIKRVDPYDTQHLYSKARSGTMLVSNVEKIIETACEKLGRLANSHILKPLIDKTSTIADPEILGLKLAAEMSALYFDKLEGKSSELAYYSTSIMNDLTEARKIYETMDELDVDLKASPIPLKNYLNSDLLPVLAGINLISNYAKGVHEDLRFQLLDINDDFKEKKENLGRVLKYHDL